MYYDINIPNMGNAALWILKTNITRKVFFQPKSKSLLDQLMRYYHYKPC